MLESATGTKIPKKWGGGGREREQEIRVPKETWKKWTRDRERERQMTRKRLKKSFEKEIFAIR
jgi:hypothetical protein